MISLTVFKNTHNRQKSVRIVDVWTAKLIDYGYPWLIMNIRDSIVGIHKAVMDIRNLIFTILNYHVYP